MDDFFTLSDDFKIWLSFSLFRDWREVEADDANGVRRRGIFIPYLQNGIHITALHPWQAEEGKVGVRGRAKEPASHDYNLHPDR